MLKNILIFFSSVVFLLTTSIVLADLQPGESLPTSSKSIELKEILKKTIKSLPQSSQRLINQGRLGITLVELEHHSKKRKWADVNGGNSLCGASTLKIYCAMAAFQAEKDELLRISETEKTTLGGASNVSETIVNIEDIRGSVLYTKGPGEGNRQAGRVCAAVNDAYLRSEGMTVPKPEDATYKTCYTNHLLKNWRFGEEVALGKLFSGGGRCIVSSLNSPPRGLPNLTTQRTSSNALSSLWVALELGEFSNLSEEYLSEIKKLLYGGSGVKGRLGREFCQSESSCYNKYGKTGTLSLRSLDLYCRNDSRVIEYPENKGKKIVLSVVCNNNYKNRVCKNDQTLERVAKSVKRLMEERWAQ